MPQFYGNCEFASRPVVESKHDIKSNESLNKATGSLISFPIASVLNSIVGFSFC